MGSAGGQTEIENFFPVVGDVCPYGWLYQGETGSQIGDGENDQVQHVQHPERLKLGSGIDTLRDVTGTAGLWIFPGDEAHKRS